MELTGPHLARYCSESISDRTKSLVFPLTGVLGKIHFGFLDIVLVSPTVLPSTLTIYDFRRNHEIKIQEAIFDVRKYQKLKKG